MPRREPYPTGSVVTDPDLLRLRQFEIEYALDAIAPPEHGLAEHALITGGRRSGRTSVLDEVARRARAERSQLVVRLRPALDDQQSSATLMRHVLCASIETLAAEFDTPPGWYSAWRSRTYLQNRDRVTSDDIFGSGLVYASGSDSHVDSAVLERDLRRLRALSEVRGFRGVTLVLDDASEISADVALLEELLATLDAAGGWAMLMASTPATVRHFAEAMSPCLRRFRRIPLVGFDINEVQTALRVPLAGAERERASSNRDFDLYRDVLRLTGGNPYEVMLVASRMWQACEIGEIEHFSLTPRVLDRVVRDIAHYAGGNDLLEGAAAIRRLPSEHIGRALELVALSRLTVPEIAIARKLGATSRDAVTTKRGAQEEDVEKEHINVDEDLERLERAGVITLADDGLRFAVRGGRAASVLLKYEARASRGPQISDHPFGLDFLRTVGRALQRDVLDVAARKHDATAIGFDAVRTSGGAVARRSPRIAANRYSRDGDLGTIIRGDLRLGIRSSDALSRLTEYLSIAESITIAVVSCGVSHAEDDAEYVEVWFVPDETTQDGVTQSLAEAVDEVQPALDLAGIRWRGTEGIVVSGEAARKLLIALQPSIATITITETFREFLTSRDEEHLAKSQRLAELTVDTLKRPDLHSWQREILLSDSLTRLGFLLSIGADRLVEARETMSQAIAEGTGAGWVARWNLANIEARLGDFAGALTSLDRTQTEGEGFRGEAYVMFFTPDLELLESLVTIKDDAINHVIDLQRAVVRSCNGDRDEHALHAALGRCNTSDDPATTAIAALVASSQVAAARP